MKNFNKSKTTVTNQEAVENFSENTAPTRGLVSVFTYFTFLLKKYLRTPATYVGYLLPLILIIGLGSLLPIDLVFMAIISVSVQIHVYTVYGNTYFNTKASTLQKSVDGLPVSKFGQQASIFLLIFFGTSIFIIFAMLLMLALQQIPGLYADSLPWISEGSYGGTNPISGLINFGTSLNNWMVFVYTVILSILVSYAVAYFFGEMFKDMKVFMVACMSYVLLTVLFSGLLAAQLIMKVQVSDTQVVLTRIPYGDITISGTDMPIRYFHSRAEYIPSNLAELGNVGGFDTSQFSPEGLQSLLSNWQTPSFGAIFGYALPHTSVNVFGYSALAQWPTSQGSASEQTELVVKWFNTYSSEMYYILMAPYIWIIGLPVVATILNKTIWRNRT